MLCCSTDMNKDWQLSPLPPSVQKSKAKICWWCHSEPEARNQVPIHTPARPNMSMDVSARYSIKYIKKTNWLQNELLKMKEITFFDRYFRFFSMAHVLPGVMEEEGFLTFTAANHQGVNKTFWLHCWALILPLLYTVCVEVEMKCYPQLS